MIFILLSSTIVVLASALVVIHMARHSAEGYEDETGFHFTGANPAMVAVQARRQAHAELAAVTQPPFPFRG